MVKTISALNSKGWYRLLKVFFVLSFLIVAVLYNSIFTFGGKIKHIDLNKTKIACIYGDKKSFTNKELELNFNEEITLSDSMNHSKILEACYGDKVNDRWSMLDYNIKEGNEQYKIKDKISGKTVTFIWYETVKPSNKDIENIFKELKIELYKVVPVYSYAGFFMSLIFGNLIILAVFEVFRRVFYYVVLGTFKPSKQ